MESPAKGTEQQDDVYMPDLDAAGEKKEDQHTCGRGDGCVCDNHDQPAVPAVHQRADERAEDDLRQQRHQGGCSQHSGRAGLLGEPPDEGELDEGRADEGKSLAGPDGEEPRSPAFGGGGGGGSERSVQESLLVGYELFHSIGQGLFHIFTGLEDAADLDGFNDFVSQLR